VCRPPLFHYACSESYAIVILECSSVFGLLVVNPADYSLVVEVPYSTSGLPVSGADVVIHPYRSRTGYSWQHTVFLSKPNYFECLGRNVSFLAMEKAIIGSQQ
jgi:hypothetical protein